MDGQGKVCYPVPTLCLSHPYSLTPVAPLLGSTAAPVFLVVQVERGRREERSCAGLADTPQVSATEN